MKKYIAFLLCLIMIILRVSGETKKDNEDKDDSSLNQNTNFEPSDSLDGDNTNDNSSTPVSEAEKAMNLYEAALNNEICVFDEQLGEISIKDCRFLNNNVTVGECERINKAILDMDGDGINEYVLQSADESDHIVLHYYDENIYSYSFGNTDFRHLNTNGTFYWSKFPNGSYTANWICGLNRLVFDGSSVSIQEIYKMNMTEDEYLENDEYCIEGKQVTYHEFIEHYQNYQKDRKKLSCFAFK